MELTRTNLPRDTIFEWFLEPLLIMEEQIKRLHLEENEEICLRILIMRCRNEKPEDWDDFGFPSSDTVRRAQLQAIFRRFLLTPDVIDSHFLGYLNHTLLTDYRVLSVPCHESQLFDVGLGT